MQSRQHKTSMFFPFFTFAILFLSLTCSMSAQQSDQDKSPAKKDTTCISTDSNPLYELNSIFEKFELTRQLHMADMANLINEDSGDAWLRMRIMINSGYFNQETETSANAGTEMLRPLYNNYLDSQKLKTLKYILGMAQVSAVGYMAYQHIKKYGFLKRK